MEKKETVKFMERIKSHYQEFVIDDFKISEWHGKLKDYDAEDVNAKLDEHLNSEVYGEQIPKVYFLTKYLIPTVDKGKVKHYTVICKACGQAVFDTEIKKHEQRCLESNSVVRDMKNYFNIKVDKQQLMLMDDKKFEATYQKYLNKMLEAPIPNFRKKIIARILYPDMEVDVNAIIDEMVGKK